MTRAKCKEMGRVTWKTEVWNPYAHIRQDLFGFIDALALGDNNIIAIQSTGPSGHSEHKRKILNNEYAKRWLRCGGVIELWSFRKLKVKRCKKASRWTPRVEQITLADFKV